MFLYLNPQMGELGIGLECRCFINNGSSLCYGLVTIDRFREVRQKKPYWEKHKNGLEPACGNGDPGLYEVMGVAKL